MFSTLTPDGDLNTDINARNLQKKVLNKRRSTDQARTSNKIFEDESLNDDRCPENIEDFDTDSKELSSRLVGKTIASSEPLFREQLMPSKIGSVLGSQG